MFKNYLITALRNLWKNKSVSLVNIFGLTMGICASLLIVVFVRHEISYDAYHKDANMIYRIVKDFINDDGSRIPDATTPAALMPAMIDEVPEVAAITRLRPNWGGTYLIKYGNKIFSEEKLYGVDTGFFDVFTFPFVRGSAKSAFEHIQSIVLTETAAERYFGKDDPLGKVLKVGDYGDMKVSGVLKDVPVNSHFHFDFLVSFQVQPGVPSFDNNWDGYNDYTYVKLKPGANINNVVNKIQSINDRNVEKSFSDFYVQPLTDIHLHSNLKWELEPNGDQQHVNIFTLIAFFVILIASINYINLTTAKSSMRAKEIGVRKVIGAMRQSLVQQFLIETVVFCVIAALLALALAQALLPVVNNLTGKQLRLLNEPLLIVYVVCGAVILGILSGIVPSLYLSSFNAIAVLKGLRLNEKGALGLRKLLVVVQFTISIVLIVGAIIITNQMQYLTSAKLGMNTEQVAVIHNVAFLSQTDQRSLVAEIRQTKGIKEVAGINGMLPNRFNTGRMSVKGSDQEQQINFVSVDYDFLKVMDIRVKDGRGFSPQFQSDTFSNGITGGPVEQNVGSIVLNETAIRHLSIRPPVIGKQLLWDRSADTSYYLTIVGVTEDFHFTSLRTQIKPFGFLTHPSAKANIVVRLDPQTVSESLAQLRDIWKKYSTERPFSFTFMDETFSQLYGAEKRFQRVFTIMVLLGIVIASMGLLGLATFAAQQRVKEIGIRKVLGATNSSIVKLLSRDFLRLILIAFVIAVPISWVATSRWLDDFAYRISINWWVFPAGGIIAMLIALFTISFQSIRAARANPVNNLRSE